MAKALPTRTLPKGVYARPKGRFFAAITVKQRYRHLGSFPTVEEAHAAYVEAARRLGRAA
jgi:hypothetical protein